MSKKQLVIAFFASEDAADTAVEAMKQWDKDTKEVDLGPVAVLVKDDKGKIKEQKVGSRHFLTGVAGGVLAAALSGGVSLLAGVVIGGALGGFFHKGTGIAKEDLERINGELEGGRAAIAVVVTNEEAEAVAAQFAALGGTVESHEVAEEAISEAATAIETEDDAVADEAEATN
jgi:uncharacterized membrane protein